MTTRIAPAPPMPCLANVSPRCPTPRNASGYCAAHQPAPAPYVSTGTADAVDAGMRAERERDRRAHLKEDLFCETCAAESVEKYPVTVPCDHMAGRIIEYIDGRPWRVTHLATKVTR